MLTSTWEMFSKKQEYLTGKIFCLYVHLSRWVSMQIDSDGFELCCFLMILGFGVALIDLFID